MDSNHPINPNPKSLLIRQLLGDKFEIQQSQSQISSLHPTQSQSQITYPHPSPNAPTIPSFSHTQFQSMSTFSPSHYENTEDYDVYSLALGSQYEVHDSQFEAQKSYMHTPSSQPQGQESERRKRKKISSEEHPTNEGRKNFSLQEDIAICKAYCIISEDGVVGKDQNYTRLWDRILIQFKNLIIDQNNRKATALSSRYGAIKKDIGKFAAKLSSSYRKKNSGWSELNHINHAHFEFQRETGSSFKYQECWEILKKNPKWSWDTMGYNHVESPSFSDMSNPCSNPGTPSTPMSSHGGEKRPAEEVLVDDLDPPSKERPPGRKSLKAAIHNNKSKRSLQKQNEIGEAHIDLISRIDKSVESRDRAKEELLELKRKQEQHMQELIDIERKKQEDMDKHNERIREIEEQKADDTVMNLNLDSYDEKARKYWEWRRNQVLEKRFGSSRV